MLYIETNAMILNMGLPGFTQTKLFQDSDKFFAPPNTRAAATGGSYILLPIGATMLWGGGLWFDFFRTRSIIRLGNVLFILTISRAGVPQETLWLTPKPLPFDGSTSPQYEFDLGVRLDPVLAPVDALRLDVNATVANTQYNGYHALFRNT